MIYLKGRLAMVMDLDKVIELIKKRKIIYMCNAIQLNKFVNKLERETKKTEKDIKLIEKYKIEAQGSYIAYKAFAGLLNEIEPF
jgi:hypothetical protein